MEIGNVKIISCLLILVICLLSGCGDDQFDKDYTKFKESYLKITDVLDSKEPFSSIEKLNQDSFLKELDEIKNIVSQLDDEASSESEKRICDTTLYQSTMMA